MQFKHGQATTRGDFALRDVKFAAADGAEAMTFKGYGAIFGNVDSYGDVIVQGAFKRTLRDAKRDNNLPAMLLQHGGWGMDLRR